MRVLLIDDDARLAELLTGYFDPQGVALVHAAAGQAGLAQLAAGGFDAVLLDVMMPGMDGLAVLRKLRDAGHRVPVIMLTARGDEADRVVGLELGADDYVAKPFSPGELVARVRALLRRATRATLAPSSGSSAPTGQTVEYGSIVMDAGRHTVTAHGKLVTLTAKEFVLLDYFLQHRGRVLSRDVLLTDVWGYRYTGGTRTVDVHIRRLREKLPLLATALVTVKQFGYKLLERPDAIE